MTWKAWLLLSLIIWIVALLLIGVALKEAFPYGADTERYIPIGQSPGVSGKLSVQGVIVKADPRTKFICVDRKADLYCTNYSRAMSVYLDRSTQRLPNTVGAWTDLVLGKYIEVYPRKWIKVRVER